MPSSHLKSNIETNKRIYILIRNLHTQVMLTMVDSLNAKVNDLQRQLDEGVKCAASEQILTKMNKLESVIGEKKSTGKKFFKFKSKIYTTVVSVVLSHIYHILHMYDIRCQAHSQDVKSGKARIETHNI